MRNFVFKYEVEYLFLKHQISEKERYDIMKMLLKDEANMLPHDKGKIFYLNSLEGAWMETVNGKTKNVSIAEELNKLLGLDDDLFMPQLLKQRIQHGEKVAVFVGAGVSKLLNYPLWYELGDKAIELLRMKRQIDDFQRSRILNDVKDPKQKLSIFENFFRKDSEEYNDFYREHFLPKAERPPVYGNPYDILVNPIFNWYKITSNIDQAFGTAQAVLLNQQEEEKKREKKEQPEEDKIAKTIVAGDVVVYDEAKFGSDLERNKIYHLHGTVDDPRSLTFTTADYIRKYYNKESATHKFLKNLFENYTVVFMGYGLEELQILESVVSGSSRKTQRHFALFGSYLNEMNFFSIRKKYFDSLNIELQHFYLDFDQYPRLTKVLQNWQQELLSEQGKNIHKNLDLIDRVLGNDLK